MPNRITAFFCYVDDFLKALSWKEDPQSRLSLSKIVSIALAAARFLEETLKPLESFSVNRVRSLPLRKVV